ncbi:MAG: hypothetical protein QM736_04180 [Vicinamibacterales bacterium]
MKRTLPVLIALGLVSLGIVTAQQLPPGQIVRRPAEGREPEFPQPKIREYHPRSTLVVPEHKVPKAKFPVIDFHHHPPQSMTVDDVNRVGDAMGALNLALMINANSTPSARLKPAMDAIAASRYKGKMVMFTGLESAQRRPSLGAEDRRAARSGHQGWRARCRRDHEELRPDHQESRRYAGCTSTIRNSIRSGKPPPA